MDSFEKAFPVLVLRATWAGWEAPQERKVGLKRDPGGGAAAEAGQGSWRSLCRKDLTHRAGCRRGLARCGPERPSASAGGVQTPAALGLGAQEEGRPAVKGPALQQAAWGLLAAELCTRPTQVPIPKVSGGPGTGASRSWPCCHCAGASLSGSLTGAEEGVGESRPRAVVQHV